MSEYRPAFMVRKGNPGFGWVVDVLWPDGETEVVKGFATEQQAAEWIAKHSEDWQGKTKLVLRNGMIPHAMLLRLPSVPHTGNAVCTVCGAALESWWKN